MLLVFNLKNNNKIILIFLEVISTRKENNNYLLNQMDLNINNSGEYDTFFVSLYFHMHTICYKKYIHLLIYKSNVILYR